METILALLNQAVSDSVCAGAVAGFVDASGTKQIVAAGTFEEDSERLLTEDSIFDVASVTKAIPVSSLALYLVDQNVVSLDTKISAILPKLQTNFRDEITLHHLLTQTLAFTTPLSSLKHLSADEILSHILTTSFNNAPGSVMRYANATSILLGLVIEAVSGKKLDVLSDEVFFKPLGMHDTSFNPSVFPKERIVPTEHDPWRGRIIRGEIHDESAWVLRDRLIPGSAGLFTTAPDVLTFLAMLCNGGVLHTKRFFSESMIDAMATNQLASIGEVGGLGWELNRTVYMGKKISERTIGKTGFTGCVVIADLSKRKAMTLLTNYHYPHRKKTSAALNGLRSSIADSVFS